MEFGILQETMRQNGIQNLKHKLAERVPSQSQVYRKDDRGYQSEIASISQ